MKTKTSILALTKAFFILLVMCCFSSCETKNTSVKSTDVTISGRPVEIYVIDSCEYIGNIYGGNGDWCTHKGNCKYCAERAKRSLK